jgi:hypothetical protein
MIGWGSARGARWFGDVEMQHMATPMLQYDEYKQHFQGERGHG